MPVYNGNSKIKELYYGGTKIKEAYYGSTKVYSSGPLYYCYRTSNTNYLYFNKYPEVGDIIYFYMYSNDGGRNFPGTQAPSSSYIYPIINVTIKSVTDTQVTYTAWADGTVSRYSSGDLYT